jgi:hypothetical protein
MGLQDRIDRGDDNKRQVSGIPAVLAWLCMPAAWRAMAWAALGNTSNGPWQRGVNAPLAPTGAGHPAPRVP